MDKNGQENIFDKFNNEADVIRCPKGKGAVKSLLNLYAKAAVNLYGSIRLEHFVGIFNDQNEEKVTVDEVYNLLLPLVLKGRYYCFYKNYLVNGTYISDFNDADYLIELQGDKPRYLPEKDEFVKYVKKKHVDNPYWDKVLRYMYDIFGNTKDVYRCYKKIIDCFEGEFEIGNIVDTINSHGMVFDNDEQMMTLLNHIMKANNNTRFWKNNGYSPKELSEIRSKQPSNVTPFPIAQARDVGRNDPCPCGSGKKYKKCCGAINASESARLNDEESRQFYEIWYGLLGFINKKKRVIKEQIEPVYPNRISDMKLHEVRETLWENPQLIDEYIEKGGLSKEETDIIRLWGNSFIKGTFLLIEYQKDFALLIGSDKNDKDIIYGVKGISNSIASTMLRKLPVMVETVLLPFKGKLIYDSYMASSQIGFKKGAMEMFGRIYEKAIKNGIVTNLNDSI
ncbi:MAG TPA: SEC-C metal-binding domain-containing protein [Anaerovoracaceae bacterium]|nr:SEC-C metal-binding domain-containing protein [Anaerovoracaceae bacterium]